MPAIPTSTRLACLLDQLHYRGDPSRSLSDDLDRDGSLDLDRIAADLQADRLLLRDAYDGRLWSVQPSYVVRQTGDTVVDTLLAAAAGVECEHWIETHGETDARTAKIDRWAIVTRATNVAKLAADRCGQSDAIRAHYTSLGVVQEYLGAAGLERRIAMVQYAAPRLVSRAQAAGAGARWGEKWQASITL